jgi:hypothetical protein
MANLVFTQFNDKKKRGRLYLFFIRDQKWANYIFSSVEILKNLSS